MRKVVAYQAQIGGPIEWMPWAGSRAIFHKIENHGEVQTEEGIMISVTLQNVADYQDPSTDVAVIVGRAKKLRRSGHVDPQSPELWYWDDRFWLKGRASDGGEYYRNKRYLIYPVEVTEPEKILGQLNSQYDH